MSRVVFYVIYLQDSRLQHLLDAIRFVADPTAKTQAHITIRGPYSQRYGVNRLERILQGSEITALGVDRFFNDRQSTVFIRCDSTALRRTLKKKHFGYNPHITLYDGTDRTFAAALHGRLSGSNMCFSFLADGLSPVISVRGQRDFALQQAFSEPFVAKLIGQVITVSDVLDLRVSERLDLIERLARRLVDFSLWPARSEG